MAVTEGRDHWPSINVQSAQIDLFWFRILAFLQCSIFCLYIYVLPAEMGSQICPKQAVRAKFDEEESDKLEVEKPNAFFTQSEDANC